MTYSKLWGILTLIQFQRPPPSVHVNWLVALCVWEGGGADNKHLAFAYRRKVRKVYTRLQIKVDPMAGLGIARWVWLKNVG